jgi:heme O synthase-like polyprenyltransferase
VAAATDAKNIVIGGTAGIIPSVIGWAAEPESSGFSR